MRTLLNLVNGAACYAVCTIASVALVISDCDTIAASQACDGTVAVSTRVAVADNGVTEVAIAVSAEVVTSVTKLAHLPCRAERTLDASL